MLSYDPPETSENLCFSGGSEWNIGQKRVNFEHIQHKNLVFSF